MQVVVRMYWRIHSNVIFLGCRMIDVIMICYVLLLTLFTLINQGRLSLNMKWEFVVRFELSSLWKIDEHNLIATFISSW